MAEKILIVDDDIETINFLKVVLSRQGYQVVAAKNGMEALAIAHNDHPDLIVLDIMMPGLDGYEVTRNLRRHPETASTPILMFTAKAQMSDKVAGYEAGVDIYLTKPVHPLELQANIKALLSQRRSRAAALLEQGYMLGVLSAKGGLGVSTLALNLAISYHKKYNTPVIAAELRPCQGSWAQELNLANSEGLTKLLQLNPYEITVNSVGEQLVRTPYDVNLLLASCAPCDAAYLSATDQIETILQQLPQLAPFVVVDIGTNFLPAYDKVVEACNEIILVTEPQPMAVRRTRVLLDDLRKKGYGSSKILTLVIYNRARADMSLNMTQIEEILGQPVALGIPPATEQAYSAAMRSIPILLVQPEGLLAQQFTKLAELVHQHLP